MSRGGHSTGHIKQNVAGPEVSRCLDFSTVGRHCKGKQGSDMIRSVILNDPSGSEDRMEYKGAR